MSKADLSGVLGDVIDDYRDMEHRASLYVATNLRTGKPIKRHETCREHQEALRDLETAQEIVDKIKRRMGL